MDGGKRSAWMSHVKRTMKANKGKSLMQVLKMAKKTYKKTGGGGGGVAAGAADVGGMMGGYGFDRDGNPLPTPPGKIPPPPPKTAGRKTRKSRGRKGSKRTRKH
jgi:hypothetical protein